MVKTIDDPDNFDAREALKVINATSPKHAGAIMQMRAVLAAEAQAKALSALAAATLEHARALSRVEKMVAVLVAGMPAKKPTEVGLAPVAGVPGLKRIVDDEDEAK